MFSYQEFVSKVWQAVAKIHVGREGESLVWQLSDNMWEVMIKTSAILKSIDVWWGLPCDTQSQRYNNLHVVLICVYIVCYYYCYVVLMCRIGVLCCVVLLCCYCCLLLLCFLLWCYKSKDTHMNILHIYTHVHNRHTQTHTDIHKHTYTFIYMQI